MKRKFITNLALLISLNLLIKPVWIFGIERTIQNIVGAGDYGFYFSLLNFSYLFNILLDLGITNYNNRNISQNTHLLSKHFSNLVTLRILLTGIYFAFCMIIAFAIRYDSNHFDFLLFLLFNQVLISFTQYLRSNLSGLHLFRIDSFLSVFDKFLMIIFCCAIFLLNSTQEFKIEWLIYLQTVSYVITAVIAFIIVLSKTQKLEFSFNLNFNKAILKQSFPFALLILLMMLYTRIDTVMLERMLEDGKEQAGIYAQSFRIQDAAWNFALLFAGLLLPIFSRMIKQQMNVNQLVKLSFLLLLIPTVILTINSCFYRKEIIALLYTSHIDESAIIFMILMISFVGMSTTNIFGTLLTANGNLKVLNQMAAIGVGMSIILNLILIPKYKATGAAMASFITQTFMALTQIIIASKLFKFRLNFHIAIKTLIYILLIITISYISSLFFKKWILGITISVSISFLIAFILKLWNLKDLYQLFRYREEEE